MRIGLLECDHVRDEFLYIAGDYRQMFPALFHRVEPAWEFRPYDVCNGELPASPDECDAYICTGSKASVYDEEPWIRQLMDFVAAVSRSSAAYVGVCFGHQILGEALGGKVRKSENGWCVGVHTFEVLERQPWMQPARDEINLLMMCQDQVLELPKGSALLAKEALCPNAMFTVGKNMLGIQAHPEFPKVYDKALMQLRVERIGEEKVEAGIASLDLPVHDLVAAQWICNFIRSAR